MGNRSLGCGCANAPNSLQWREIPRAVPGLKGRALVLGDESASGATRAATPSIQLVGRIRPPTTSIFGYCSQNELSHLVIDDFSHKLADFLVAFVARQLSFKSAPDGGR